jgi:FHA domain
MADETLKITGGNAAGQTITLEQELVIGRSTPGLGSLGGDTEISRVHARIFNDPSGRLMVEDLGSTNGTFVNGNRISGQQPLNPGDQVRVGQTTMSVEGGAAGGATTVGNVITPPPAAAQPPPPAAVAATPPTQQQPAAGFGQGPGAPPPPPGGPGYAGGPTSGPPQRSTGGNNRNLLIALAALLLIGLVVAGLAIGGVFGGDDEDTEPTAQTTPATTTTPTTETAPTVAMPEPPPEEPAEEPSGDGYPPGFKKQFVDSCASGGAPRSICACTFDSLKEKYTFTEFVDLLSKAEGGNLPPPVENAVRDCAA